MSFHGACLAITCWALWLAPPSPHHCLLHLLPLQVQFKFATPQETQEYLQLRSTLSDKNLAIRDTRGFR